MVLNLRADDLSVIRLASLQLSHTPFTYRREYTQRKLIESSHQRSENVSETKFVKIFLKIKKGREFKTVSTKDENDVNKTPPWFETYDRGL